MVAADCLASYGSLARYRQVQRVSRIGKNTILGTSGDVGDMQSIIRQLEHHQ